VGINELQFTARPGHCHQRGHRDSKKYSSENAGKFINGISRRRQRRAESENHENTLHCSIGVIVFTEPAHPGAVAAWRRNRSTVVIDRVVVVSSACTDGTDDIVEAFAATHPRVSLIKEPERGASPAPSPLSGSRAG
jgi:hypothetical protein